MNDVKFSAKLSGREIICEILSRSALQSPVFCFSLMAPPAVISGGTMLKTDGGYGEVQLPDIQPDETHCFTLSYADPRFIPANRAWLPLGPYLRVGSEIVQLPALVSGMKYPAPKGTPVPTGLGLVPAPVSWERHEGKLAAHALATSSELFAAASDLAKRCNLPPLFDPAGVKFTISQSAALASDAYEMSIAPDGISLVHGGAEGAHYGAITFLVLRAIHKGQLPCGVIKDRPRFQWRGQHLDCARHFYEVPTIKRLIDLMALLKLNRFHWHFSDDEAFRLEVESAPELWEQTRMRGEGHPIPGVFGCGPNSGGSYSKEEARKIVGHAKELFIDVLPEIEFPAHALGFARVYPHLRDPADSGDEVSVQGYHENVLNPALDSTWDIVESLAIEVGTMFPFGMLHLGADELPPRTWEGSPLVDDLKVTHGLNGADDVQGWALDRLAKTISDKGIRPAAWEEAAKGSNGGIGNNAVLFSWTGQEAGLDAAKAGYDIVMSPAQNVYLDMAHSAHPDDWGAAWASFIGLRDTVDWAVVPDPKLADRIIGVEGTFWSEFTTKDHEMEPMIAPRILGVATKGWCQEEAVDIDQFVTDAHSFCTILTTMGWQWNTNCFPDTGA